MDRSASVLASSIASLGWEDSDDKSAMNLGKIDRRRFQNQVFSFLYRLVWLGTSTLCVPAKVISSRSTMKLASSTCLRCSTHSTTQPIPTTRGFGSLNNLQRTNKS